MSEALGVLAWIARGWVLTRVETVLVMLSKSLIKLIRRVNNVCITRNSEVFLPLLPFVLQRRIGSSPIDFHMQPMFRISTRLSELVTAMMTVLFRFSVLRRHIGLVLSLGRNDRQGYRILIPGDSCKNRLQDVVIPSGL